MGNIKKLKVPSVYRWLLSVFVFCAFTVTLDLRPGRIWFIYKTLLFQFSLIDLGIFGLCFLGASMAIVILLLSDNKAIAFMSIMTFAVTFFISSIYRFITGYDFTYVDWLIAKGNLHLGKYVLGEFGFQIGLALVSTFALVVLIIWIRQKFVLSTKLYFWPIVLLGLFAGYYEIDATAGTVDHFPAFIRIPSIIINAFINQIPDEPRRPVSIHTIRPGTKNIYLIVDESVMYDALSINGNPANTTPFLSGFKGNLMNFGKTISFTNYSAGSNISLVSGARMVDLPDTLFRILLTPNIFQFAKSAGYKTYLIDAQMADGQWQNFLTNRDGIYIDSLVQIANIQKDRLKYEDRDLIIADLLGKLSIDSTPKFVYVVKHGAHWPYARTYPLSETIFSPCLERNSFIRDRIKSRNSYYNSIRWNVDHFWEVLVDHLKNGDSTFILYTSDHGQDLDKEGIQISHASIYDVSPKEVEVPMWIYTNFDKKIIVPNNPLHHHEEIFPILLFEMGYDSLAVKYSRGNQVLAKKKLGNYFLTGDVFGRSQWHLNPVTSNKN